MDKAAFNEEVGINQVLVDFYADWCGPCKAIEPSLLKIAEERNLKLVKVNIDESRELAEKYGVASIPFVALFTNGEVSRVSVGAVPKSQLEKNLGLS